MEEILSSHFFGHNVFGFIYRIVFIAIALGIIIDGFKTFRQLLKECDNGALGTKMTKKKIWIRFLLELVIDAIILGIIFIGWCD